jgi:hypothetical protein
MSVDLRDLPPVAENIERPDTLSQTLLSRFDVCPRSAYLMRRYGGGPASSPMHRGQAFHEFAEQATNMMIENGEVQMPGDVAREMADAIMAEHDEWVLPTQAQDEVRLMAWNWAESTLLDLEAIVAVELSMELELGGFTLTSRFDRVEARDETLNIFDYKTSLNLDKTEYLQRGYQGQHYGLTALDGKPKEQGVGIGAGINYVTFTQLYPRYRTEDGYLASRTVGWTRAELSDFRISVERNVAAFDSYLADGRWPATPGSHCGTCPAPKECPIPFNLRPVKTITSEEEAERTFEALLFAAENQKELQTAMREWTKEAGPTFLGDLAFDAVYSESKSVKDLDALLLAVQRAAEYGEPLKIEDHLKVRQSTSFKKRKQTPEEMESRV